MEGGQDKARRVENQTRIERLDKNLSCLCQNHHNKINSAACTTPSQHVRICARIPLNRFYSCSMARLNRFYSILVLFQWRILLDPRHDHTAARGVLHAVAGVVRLDMGHVRTPTLRGIVCASERVFSSDLVNTGLPPRGDRGGNHGGDGG